MQPDYFVENLQDSDMEAEVRSALETGLPISSARRAESCDSGEISDAAVSQLTWEHQLLAEVTEVRAGRIKTLSLAEVMAAHEISAAEVAQAKKEWF